MLLDRIVSATNAGTGSGQVQKNVTMGTLLTMTVVQMNAISTMAGPATMGLMNLSLFHLRLMTTLQLQSAFIAMTASSKEVKNVTMEAMTLMVVSQPAELMKATLVTWDLTLQVKTLNSIPSSLKTFPTVKSVGMEDGKSGKNAMLEATKVKVVVLIVDLNVHGLVTL